MRFTGRREGKSKSCTMNTQLFVDSHVTVLTSGPKLLFVYADGSKSVVATDAHKEDIRAIAMSKGHALFASVGDDKIINIWDRKGNKLHSRCTPPTPTHHHQHHHHHHILTNLHTHTGTHAHITHTHVYKPTLTMSSCYSTTTKKPTCGVFAQLAGAGGEEVLIVGSKTGDIVVFPAPDISKTSRFLLGHTASRSYFGHSTCTVTLKQVLLAYSVIWVSIHTLNAVSVLLHYNIHCIVMVNSTEMAHLA